MVRRDGLMARLIEARGHWTPAEAARQADCPAVNISRYESGERNPSVLALRGLAEVYGCSYQWLKDGTGAKQNGEPTGHQPHLYDLLSGNAQAAVDELVRRLVQIEGRSGESRREDYDCEAGSDEE